MTNVSTPSTSAPLRPPSAAALPQKGPSAADERAAAASVSFNRLKRSVVFQAWAIAVLACVLLVLLPFSRPVYLYYAMNPEKKAKPLSALTMPNMTDSAILSWATTSITEVMTMGFGDMDIRLPKQRERFTEKGWEAYMKSFKNMEVRETFKQSQLVLTTVPSNTPVILGQGVNLENVYQWYVQMPIIMTYATNNNVMRRQRSTVTLTIIRVPTEETFSGIAIKNWNLQ